MRAFLVIASLAAQAGAASYTLCTETNNPWLPSECCIASEATSFKCTTTHGLIASWDDCEGGPPDQTNLAGCMGYSYQSDSAYSTIYKGKGTVWWYTKPTLVPPCPAHGNITIKFSVSAS